MITWRVSAGAEISHNVDNSSGQVIPQVAQAPRGAVNMTLRNSVIFIRVCMGIERSYKIVQNRGKRSNKIDLPSHLLSITCVSGIAIAIETQVILRRWEAKSILLDLFPLF